MGKGALPVAVSHRPDARHVRTQLIIDLDVTMLINRNAGLIEPQVIGIGTTSYCKQEVGAANRGTAACAVKRNCQFRALFPYGQALCVKAHVDTVALQYFSYCG